MKIKKCIINNKIYLYIAKSNKILIFNDINKYKYWRKSQKYIENIDKNNANSIFNEFMNEKNINPDQIIINLTNDCNLKCTYCIYSEKYKFTRKINYQVIKLDTIKSFLNEFLHKNENKKLISFYGGEPLLQFTLLSDVVNFCTSNFNKISFSITTNGTLMNNQIVNFLVKNSFVVSISIDKNKNLHDKNRIFHNGQGTFQVIKNKLNMIKNKYPDFYKNNLCFLATIENFSDFKQEIDPDLDKNMFLTNLTDQTGEKRWQDIKQYIRSTRDNSSHNNTKYDFLSKFSEFITDQKEFPTTYSTWMISLLKIHYRESLPNNNILNGSCFPPGSIKIFLSTNGEYYVCEKMDYTFSIGNIQTGIDYEKVNDIVKKFYNFKKDTCKTCWAKKLCSLCYISFAQKGNKFIKDRNKCILERKEIDFF